MCTCLHVRTRDCVHLCAKTISAVPDAGRVLPHITHPRSRWLEQALSSPKAMFAMIARAADVSHAPSAAKKSTSTQSTNTGNLPSGIGVLADAAREEGGVGAASDGGAREHGELSGKEEALRRLSKLHGNSRALKNKIRWILSLLLNMLARVSARSVACVHSCMRAGRLRLLHACSGDWGTEAGCKTVLAWRTEPAHTERSTARRTMSASRCWLEACAC
jgi:hypothetical protein